MNTAYLFKFKKLSIKEIEKIIDPFNLGLFEIYTPLADRNLDFAYGAVISESSLDYLKDRFNMFKVELNPATKEEFLLAKDNIRIDFAYINNGEIMLDRE